MTVKTTTKRIRFEGYYATVPGIRIDEAYGPITYYDQRVGLSNPRWREQVAAQQNASTALSAFSNEIREYPIDYSVNYEFRLALNKPWLPYVASGHGMPVHQNVYPLVHTQVSKISEANADAIRKLYRKLRKVRSQFAGGIVLGEFRKTVDLVARPALSLKRNFGSYLKNARKALKNTNPEKASKALAELYLEATFGWEPLLNDIADGAKALERLATKRSHLRFKVKASSASTKLNSTLDIARGRAHIRRDTERQRTDEVIYYGAFKEHVLKTQQEDRLQKIVDLSGFSWRDFLPTAWELLPWSFLVDYFTNIGDLIEALVTDVSIVNWLTKVEISTTVETTSFNVDVKTTQAALPLPYYRYVSSSNSTGTTYAKYRTINRAVNLTVPTMPFRVESPDLWSRQTLNIVALLRTANSGRFR